MTSSRKLPRRWSRAERAHWLEKQRCEAAVLIALNAANPVRAKPPVTKVLRVQNEYFTAAAVFNRNAGFWTLAQCAPILNWMRRTAIDRIPLELLKRGCRWQWSTPAVPVA